MELCRLKECRNVVVQPVFDIKARIGKAVHIQFICAHNRGFRIGFRQHHQRIEQGIFLRSRAGVHMVALFVQATGQCHLNTTI